MTEQVSSRPTTTGDQRRPRRLAPILVALATASAAWIAVADSGAQATTTTVVVPNALANSQGSGPNAFPFNCGGALFPPPPPSMRYQQVYDAAQVGSGSISQLAFRGGTFASTVIPNVTIKLSTTSKAVTGLEATFANNVGPDVTTVFAGNLTLSGNTGATYPGPFDIVIPLQTSFNYTSTSGNLLLDVTIPTCTGTDYFDFDFRQPPVAMARVVSFNSSDTTGQLDATGFYGGLVTQFTLGPTTPSGCVNPKTGQPVPCNPKSGPPTTKP